jgi:phosphoadenosine phosphosulfate reductase
MRVTQPLLRSLNQRFAVAEPLEILRFAREAFGERAAILSSMQRAGTALCHLADRAGIPLDVLFVDTGVLHQETLATRDKLVASCPNLRVVTLSPAHSFAEQTAAEGLLYVTREGQERCCHLRKTEPLLAVKGRYDALLGAVRRDEGGARARVSVFELDPTLNALRIHPFATLTDAALDAYIASNPDLPMNPLHSMGFPTIGCFTCTTPVRPDEPARAGRWRHLAGVDYCGINPFDHGEGSDGITLDDRYASLFA